MEDKKVFETYNKLVPVIEDVAIGNPIKDADLQVFTGAALMKCLEFNGVCSSLFSCINQM